MKQVKVDGLTVYTGPDTDAYLMGATVARQLILRQDDVSRRVKMEAEADQMERGLSVAFRGLGVRIRIVDADIRHHVPECGHELYAAGACKTVKCDNYFMKVSVAVGSRTSIAGSN